MRTLVKTIIRLLAFIFIRIMGQKFGIDTTTTDFVFSFLIYMFISYRIDTISDGLATHGKGFWSGLTANLIIFLMVRDLRSMELDPTVNRFISYDILFGFLVNILISTYEYFSILFKSNRVNYYKATFPSVLYSAITIDEKSNRWEVYLVNRSTINYSTVTKILNKSNSYFGKTKDKQILGELPQNSYLRLAEGNLDELSQHQYLVLELTSTEGKIFTKIISLGGHNFIQNKTINTGLAPVLNLQASPLYMANL